MEDYGNYYKGDMVDFYSSICDQNFHNVSEFYDCQESITYEKDRLILGKDSVNKSVIIKLYSVGVLPCLSHMFVTCVCHKCSSHMFVTNLFVHTYTKNRPKL